VTMKLASACYQCLRRLIYQAAELATNDISLKQRATKEAIKILDDEFSYSQLSIVIATKIHKVIRDVTHNPDPYRTMKEREMALARELCPKLSLRVKGSNLYKDEFQGCLQLAAAANAIDFFREPGSIEKDIREPVNFVIDDAEQFEAKLEDTSKVLYLADNAGELYFDLPLVKWMKQFAEVIYVVKPSPVQNDLTLKDVRKSGLACQFGKVISTGIASPGIVFPLASARFEREFKSADLIFAKGMGYYEALSEFPPEGKFFYCLKAKCQPVADSLGVSMNSYVAMLQ
ncbi:MAG TPA: ARMT1-like domain-containing protein, partial [Dehalococcoidia bacterium]|nr:ARMT1-like domain-containing protein [Dehalococcoidia bacterium]